MRDQRRERWVQLAFDTGATVAAGAIVALTVVAFGLLGTEWMQDVAAAAIGVAAFVTVAAVAVVELRGIDSARRELTIFRGFLFAALSMSIISAAALWQLGFMWGKVAAVSVVPMMSAVTWLGHHYRIRDLRATIRAEEEREMLHRDVGFPG